MTVTQNYQLAKPVADYYLYYLILYLIILVFRLLASLSIELHFCYSLKEQDASEETKKLKIDKYHLEKLVIELASCVVLWCGKKEGVIVIGCLIGILVLRLEEL